MRYFLAFFVLACVLVVVIAGRRGDLTRQRPIEIWNDMDRQIKFRPQEPSAFDGWRDHRASRPWVEGTVPRLQPISAGGTEVRRYEDHPVITGREAGRTNFVEVIPLPVTEALMARGQERYEIYCTPCHGSTGDGNGVVKQYGHAAIAPLIDEARIKLSDGYIYSVIEHGSPSGLMGPYGGQVDVEDRWAIVAYVRTLQLARLGKVEELPEALRATLP